ncbi:hypothetical protein OIU74_007241 [Salix koriyanagi]|uniref:Uncharacterized protein n=1 Tax=Salix koriyanagi TaxID=2511006 RepID=A0A9Q0U336_9ROSI|nr:hypothetical protein OIU74_007241 [Salix koriyanagi]
MIKVLNHQLLIRMIKLIQPLAVDQTDQVVQLSAADQTDQVVQPPADEIKKARKRARRMEYLNGKKQKIEDAERQLEEMKEDFAGSEKDHACSIEKTRSGAGRFGANCRSS